MKYYTKYQAQKQHEEFIAEQQREHEMVEKMSDEERKEYFDTKHKQHRKTMELLGATATITSLLGKTPYYDMSKNHKI